MNPLQLAAIAGLVAAFKSVRNIDATYKVVPIAETPTVSAYVINPLSVCIQMQDATGVNLPDFPVIELRKTGKPALPSIRSYRESAGQNTLQPYPQGATAFDAALFADSHVRKQGGAWLRRSPQAGTAEMVGSANKQNPAALASIPVSVLAPAGVSAETGQDTGKMLAEIQGKGKGKDGK
jgi:hypothetical protein